MGQKLSDTLVKAIDRSNPMMQNLQLASRFNKLVDENFILNVKCDVSTNGYSLAVAFPRSNKVTDIAIYDPYTDHTNHYDYNGNGYIIAEFEAVEAGMKASVVYDGDTYSYTYTSRDLKQHDLIKE